MCLRGWVKKKYRNMRKVNNVKLTVNTHNQKRESRGGGGEKSVEEVEEVR